MTRLLRVLLLACVLLSVAVAAAVWFLSYPARPGRFFDAAAPAGTPPGVMLAAQPYEKDLPAGAEARRILYTTTLSDGLPATASALVIWKPGTGNAGPRRTIAWAPGTAGAAPGCGVSLQGEPFHMIPDLPELLEAGWVLVGTDYAGLGTKGPHPYLIGQGEARSVLDAVRAARGLDEVSLAPETLVWGHSQGGHAALWAGMIAGDYAPDIDLRGVAAFAPASDVPALLSAIGATPSGRLFSSYVARAYGDTYADVSFDSIVRPGARWPAREVAKRCLSLNGTAVSAFLAQNMKGSIFAEGNAAFEAHLKDNVPAGPFGVPLLIVQGEADDVVSAAMQAAYAARLCASGETVDFISLPGHSHVSIILPGAPSLPLLMDWSAARFDGAPAPSTCAP
ncbi:MAG: lipase family protein [Hyphomonas sp.]